MELTVETGEGEGRELYEWLVNDPEVAGSVPITQVDEDPGGAMGAGFELLNLIIPNVIALSSLGVSIATFIQQRRAGGGPEPKVQVRIQGDVVLLGTDAEEVLRRLFQAELGGGGQPGTPDDR